MFKMLTIGLSIVMIMQNKQVVRNSKKYVMRLFMNQTDQVHS